MPEYNFWADLFDTYQSTADWIKALWIVAVPGFLLGLIALIFQYRLASKQAPLADGAELLCTVHRGDAAGRFRVYRHTGSAELAPKTDAGLLLLERDRADQGAKRSSGVSQASDFLS